MHVTLDSSITLQYCIIGEGIDPQRFGAITDGTRNWTVHHNLWIDEKSRNPKMKCFLQYINNVVYNWGCCGIIGGHSAAVNYQDVINNYFIAGPSSSADYLSDWTATDNAYSSGNYIDANKDGALNGIPVTTADFSAAGATVRTSPYLTSPVPVTVESAANAYISVMNKAGASLHRLTMDNRLIGQLKSLGKQGANIADESVVGGVGTVKGGTPPADADKDGMPDAWETAHGLNPANAADRNSTTLSKDGYTNLEVYLDELAGDFSPSVSIARARDLAVRGAAVNNGVEVRFVNDAVELTASATIETTVDFLDLSGRTLCTVFHGKLTQGKSVLRIGPQTRNLIRRNVVMLRVTGSGNVERIIKYAGIMLD
jgi:hypothetical protein